MRTFIMTSIGTHSLAKGFYSKYVQKWFNTKTGLMCVTSISEIHLENVCLLFNVLHHIISGYKLYSLFKTSTVLNTI